MLLLKANPISPGLSSIEPPEHAKSACIYIFLSRFMPRRHLKQQCCRIPCFRQILSGPDVLLVLYCVGRLIEGRKARLLLPGKSRGMK